MINEININVKWISGKSQKIKINILSIAKEIVDLCYIEKTFISYPFLLYKGKLLDLSVTIQSQRIQDNDIVVVYEHGVTFGDNNQQSITLLSKLDIPLIRNSPLGEKINSLANEVLRLNDSKIWKLEEILRKKLNNLKENQIRFENFDLLNLPTIVPQKSIVPSIEPLPFLNINTNNSDLEELDVQQEFNSIEEASKFFEKQVINEWKW